jgi:hypothetical protein
MTVKQLKLYCLVHEHAKGRDGHLFFAESDDVVLKLDEGEIAAQIGVDFCITPPAHDEKLIVTAIKNADAIHQTYQIETNDIPKIN